MASKTKKKEVAPVQPKKLIALRPILFDGRQYKTGEQLPAHDSKIVAAWLDGKSVKWESEETAEEPKVENTTADSADTEQEVETPAGEEAE